MSSREQRLEAADLVFRLRAQHSDLQQGAYYGPDEDPMWDVTLAAAEFIDAVLGEQDTYCHKCDTDSHRCGGCGTPLPHGVAVCAACLGEQDTTPPEPYRNAEGYVRTTSEIGPWSAAAPQGEAEPLDCLACRKGLVTMHTCERGGHR